MRLSLPAVIVCSVGVGIVLGRTTSDGMQSHAATIDQAQPKVSGLLWKNAAQLPRAEQDQFINGFVEAVELYRVEKYQCIVDFYKPDGIGRGYLYEDLERQMMDMKFSSSDSKQTDSSFALSMQAMADHVCKIKR